MIEVLNSTELPRAREAGALVAGILQTLKSRCEVGTNLRDINLWARAMITEAGAQSCYVDYEPSFGRGPFGHYICTSVNDAVLHGLPYDYTLANGDLLTLDLAVSKGGVVADSAISFIVGDSKSSESVAMISATERAFERRDCRGPPRSLHRGYLPCHRRGPQRGGVSDQHRVRRSWRRLDDAPGPARPEHRATRSWIQTAPWASAGIGAVGHGGHRRARHRYRWLDTPKRDGLPDCTQ